MPSDKKANKKTKSKTKKQDNKHKIILVTGFSGAGMSAALKSLEDVGYEVFDNFPMDFVEQVVTQKGYTQSPVAFALDTRSRGFSPKSIVDMTNALKKNPKNEVQLVFMTCSNLVLQKRFSETRRSHPLAKDRPALDGIRQERTWLKPLMDSADLLIDTSDITVHELRRQVESSIHPDKSQRKLTITITSFGFKNGVPRESDMVLDVRFLSNPHWVDSLRPQTGKDKAIQKFIEKDKDLKKFVGATEEMLKLLLPRYTEEGKYYFTLAFGCTGGRHRSVYLAERMSKTVEAWGYNVSTRHRDLDE